MINIGNYIDKGVAGIGGVGLCLSLLGAAAAPGRAMAASTPACTVGTSTIAQCFPDKELSAAVAKEEKAKTTDTFTQTMIDNTTALADASPSTSITSIDGIQRLTNLNDVNLSYNNITDVTPLEGLSKLSTLDISRNKPASIDPLKKLTNLTNLNISSDGITDLTALKGLNKLKVLDADSNKIKDLKPLSGLVNLTNLDLSYNEDVNDLSPLSSLTKIQEIELQDINLKGTPKTDISALKSMPDLTSLDLDFDSVADISVLSNNHKLESLSAIRNDITDIRSLSNLTGLVNVKLSGNNITDASPVKNLTNLELLWLDSNRITDSTPLKNLTNMTDLNMDSNNIKTATNLSGMTKMVNLDISSTGITDLTPLLGMTNIDGLVINNDNLKDISLVSKLSTLTYLSANDNDISDITSLNTLIKMNRLYLNDNKISDISAIESMPNLQLLGMNNNNVSDISPLKSMNNPLGIEIANNHINDVTPLANKDMSSLDDFDMTGQTITYPAITNPKPDSNGEVQLPSPVNEDGSSVEPESSSNNYIRYDATTKKLYLNINKWEAAGRPDIAYDFYATLPNVPSDPMMIGSNSFSGTVNLTVSIDHHTLNFDANGGSNAPAKEYVDYANKPAEPSTKPTRKGYTFTGWYTTKNGGTKFDFTKLMTSDATVYAHWIINNYKITFDTEGIGTAPNPQTIEYGHAGEEPSAPAYEHHTFDGWYTAKTGGTKFDFANTPITSDITLYAHWTTDSYTVSFEAMNNGDNPSDETVTYNDHATAPADPVLDGYTFAGWYTDANAGTKFDFAKTPITSDIKLYGHWTKNAPSNPVTPDNPSNPGNNGGNTNNNGSKNNKVKLASTKSNGKLAQTGSDTHIMAYSAIGLTILGSLCYGLFALKRRRN